MKTHTEDKPKSGIVRKPFTTEFTYRYATSCGVLFYGGDSGHALTDPGKAPTCPSCDAVACEDALHVADPAPVWPWVLLVLVAGLLTAAAVVPVAEPAAQLVDAGGEE